LPYVFGTVSGPVTHAAELAASPSVAGLSGTAVPAAIPESADGLLSSRMMRYWSRFAATGDPNAVGQPLWPRYDPPRDRLLVLDVPAAEAHPPYAIACEVSERASQLH
jgi:carboxylesterase type B